MLIDRQAYCSCTRLTSNGLMTQQLLPKRAPVILLDFSDKIPISPFVSKCVYLKVFLMSFPEIKVVCVPS